MTESPTSVKNRVMLSAMSGRTVHVPSRKMSSARAMDNVPGPRRQAKKASIAPTINITTYANRQTRRSLSICSETEVPKASE